MTLSDLFTILCACAAACGAAGLIVGVRRLARLLRARRCPRCGYDLRGLAARVCPECGPGPSPRRRRTVGMIAVSLLLIALLPAWMAWPDQFRSAWWWVRYPNWILSSTSRYGPLVIREFTGGRPDNLYSTRYEAEFMGRRVREGRDVRPVHSGTMAGSAENPAPYPGPDLNRDGKPEVVLLEYSGGAHCCYTAYVYDVSRTPVLLATVDGRHSPPDFEDADHDGFPEAVVRDWTWDYFYSFAEAPAPRVILRWTGAEFVVAPDLMRTTTPDEEELHSIEQGLGAAKSYLAVPPPVLHAMLELMYTGHEDLAWRLFDRIYPHPTQEQRGWADRLRGSMDSSPYWPTLKKAWNGPK